MHIYDKKDTDYRLIMWGKIQKWQNWYSLYLNSKYVDCFKYNFVYIFFYHAATNYKLDGNWKISANVIHFPSFAGMLPVIFWIFPPIISYLSSLSKTEVTCQNDGHDEA